MLPTEKATGIVSRAKETNIIQLGATNPRNQYWIDQHLYITSDEKVTEGTKCYDLAGKVVYVQEIDEEFASIGSGMACPVEQLRIIVASTDASLDLPLLPESFIKKYVEENGKIDEILVEFKEIKAPFENESNRADISYTKQVPVIRENNTIRILPAKTYAREEVIDLIRRYSEEMGMVPGEDFIRDEWVNKNI